LHDRRGRPEGRRRRGRRLKKLLKSLRVGPLGDAAAYAEFSDTLDLEINEGLHTLALTLRARAPAWVRDIVPALTGIAVHFDTEHAELPAAPLGAAENLIRECIDAMPWRSTGRAIEVPVCYDPEFALDIVEVAGRSGIEPEDIAVRHTRSEHRVLMVGFAPGLPYLAGLDPALALPRRATPRTRVPAGSVAVANLQTTVYPFETPGGWSVIGRTPLILFDPAREAPSLFSPGDRVRFVPISRSEYARLK
jgi:KipI family sensor histidine kinase inhibitor